MLGDLAEGGLLGGSDVGTQVALLTGSPAHRRTPQGAAGRGLGRCRHRHRHPRADPGARAFSDLGLVVVDEQHRFGVEQREALRSKGSRPPHVLVMTATPIPRTVAMTVFGDMETSTLTELPRGPSPDRDARGAGSPTPSGCERTWQRVAEEVRQGHQAYVVCPRIGDDAQEAGPDTRCRRGEGRRRDRGRRPRMLPPTGTARSGDRPQRELRSVRASWRSCAPSRPCGAAGRGAPRPDGARGQGRRDAGLRRGGDRRPRLHDRHRGRCRRAERDGHGGHGRRALRRLPAAPAARAGGARRCPGLCLLVTETEPAAPRWSASRPSPRRPTGSSSPASTSNSAAKATCSAPARAAAAPSCGCCACCATRT